MRTYVRTYIHIYIYIYVYIEREREREIVSIYPAETVLWL